MKKMSKPCLIFFQLLLLVFLITLWELFSRWGLISNFLVSRPSSILTLFSQYLKTGEIFKHIKISLLETTLGLIIGTGLGILFAILLWWFPTLSRILDPYLVVLNALPKTALAPIFIIWAGTGVKGIVVVAISLSIVITVINLLTSFNQVDVINIKMMKSLNANRYQILTKLILPANIGNIFTILKVNIGMSWVGVIVGEFLVSREGIGYLIVYGGQVFRMDIVMMGVIILGILAFGMYLILEGLQALYNFIRYKKWRKSNVKN